MTKRVLAPTSLLINQPFALRQHNGLPVYTEIKKVKSQRTEQEISDAVSNIHKKMDETGFGYTRGFDSRCKKFFEEAPKRTRIKTNYPIDLHQIQRIILTPNAKGYISTAFLEFAKEHSIPLYFIDAKGKIEMSLIPFNYKKPSIVLKQYEALTNGKGLEIAKYIVKLKLESHKLEKLICRVDKATNLKDVIRIEGYASDWYFKDYGKNFDKSWGFLGRHGRGKSNNFLAVDPVNCMLNFGYTILSQQMSEILLKRGFELSIGFLHSNLTKNNHWNMLAADFIEPYRCLIDECIVEIIRTKKIKMTDFTFSEDKSHIILKDNALEIVLNKLMETLESLEHKSLPIIRNVEGML